MAPLALSVTPAPIDVVGARRGARYGFHCVGVGSATWRPTIAAT